VSPSFVVVHGAGEGGFSQGLGAYQQGREFEAEARRREGQYQLEKKLALRRMQLAEEENARQNRGLQLDEEGQAFNQAQATQESARRDQGMALDERQVASQEKFNDARASSFAQEFEIAASQEEREKEIQKRRIAEIDKGLDQEKALAMFQSMQAAGIDLREDRGMREGIKAAGKVLGGGIGQALALMANATPQAAAVFERLPAEYRGRYLVDMAEEQKLARMDLERNEGLELAQTLVESGDITPEDGEAIRQEIATAEDEGALRGALEPLFGARRNAITKATKVRQRMRLQATLERKIVQIQEVEGFEHIVGRYEAMLEELVRDPNPNMQAWAERISSVTGEAVRNPEEDLPLPSFGAGQDAGPDASGGQPPAGPPPKVDPIEAGVEAEILAEIGIEGENATPEQIAEGDRELAEQREKARDMADRFIRWQRKELGSTFDLLSQGELNRHTQRFMGKRIKEEGIDVKDKLVLALIERQRDPKRRDVRKVMVEMRGEPDERIVTELVRSKVVKDRAEARELMESERSQQF
jgi:hypothetical protein